MGFSEGLSFVGKCEDFNIAVNTALKSLILFSLGQQLNHSCAAVRVVLVWCPAPASPHTGPASVWAHGTALPGEGFAPSLHHCERSECLKQQPRL